ncbi:large ribosomal subunit protein eL20z-like isoform X3 [Nicotiana tomentosiformis]|uniref:large ribosomal subunit protein eL20z-like isoform X3 n=1 Tax=Nicotiana tomentosiformis TaxID=4098 RepID=UPI00087888D8|nr:60S ribosomal protein L18a-like protein isoform X3 [Nicotiana tomentosiformis]
MSEEGKDSHHHHHGHHHHHHHHEDDQPPPPPPPPPPPAEYGTFQAPPQPVVGFPQPVPPPGAFEPSPEYYARAYQVVPGYVVDERGPVREPRLPCCGIGLGWFLFITGFFLVAIPWYVAAFILLCTRSVDHREKPGYVTCTIAQAYKVMVYNITLQVIIETSSIAGGKQVQLQ